MLEKESKIIIKNNKDWNNLENLTNLKETLIDISNNSYFGYRAMEKGAGIITYDPCLIDSLIRIVKNSKKFKGVKHTLILSAETLGYESKNNNEIFLKKSTRLIESMIEINPSLLLDFKINTSSEKNNKIIYDFLKNIYIKTK